MNAHATKRLRVARWLVTATLFVFCLDIGGGLYEHLVVDTVWIDNPTVIQSGRGGVDRKLFWIPIHGALTLLLVGALWASWSDRPVRNRVLVATGLYLVMRAWTFAYFVPLVAEFEALQGDTLSPEMRSMARQWVTLSLLRMPLVAGSAVALWLAGRRLDAHGRDRPDARPG